MSVPITWYTDEISTGEARIGAMIENSPNKPQSQSFAKRFPWQKYRFALVVLLFVGAYFSVWRFNLDQYFEREFIRRMIESAGVWGFLLFIAIFSLGELLHIPGLVFVAAAMLAYDRSWGTAVSLIGAVTSVTVSFIVVRTIGGQAFTQMRQPFVKRMLVRLDARPIATVAILRLIFWMALPINYALAMTRLKLRDYIIGSAFGLVAPVVLAALFLESVIENWL